MCCYLRNTLALHSEVDVTNADNPGGHVIGQLYRYTNTGNTFVIVSRDKVPADQFLGQDVWWYEVLVDGVIKGIKQRDFNLALGLGKIELVK